MFKVEVQEHSDHYGSVTTCALVRGYTVEFCSSQPDYLVTGEEHQANNNTPARPSFCNMPIFHAQATAADLTASELGYVSQDGHLYGCKNPATMQQAFHM